ncbi:M28 family peptidase [Collinsella provencensis]|uniref:M28 family peptidase n=1 Tax=Collinsella provencensis TaxID=1937461 RepID=UPI000C82F14C|nr:M28 family peptidase [Collinsella provencensis]
MGIKINGTEASILLSRRAALLGAGAGAASLALAGCSGNKTNQGSAPAAPASVIDEEAFKAALDCIDRDYVYNLCTDLSMIGNDDCELGFRNAGSTGENKCRERIVKEMEAIGLGVQVDTYPVHAWEFRSAGMTVGDEQYTLSSFAGAPGTDGPLTAELIDCGDGTAANYVDKDVAGKIVITHFDNYNYWFMAPAYEAELAGARAIIVETIGENYNVGTDTLYCFDVASRDSIPVLCITKDDAAKLAKQMEAGEVTATLNVDATIDKQGESGNVLGMIPAAVETDQNITTGAHFDGYFHAFMDDVWGVAVWMGIAKALVDSGYKPNHNIIFIAFGSEEYGTTNNHYDWCTGVWNQINTCKPEWVGQNICHLEMDSVRPDADTYIVNATPELHSWFKARLEGIEPPSDQYVNGFELRSQNGPWGQDYDMEIAGVPGFCAGKTGNSIWKTKCYHTNASSPENDWNETVFTWISEQYLRMLMEFDGCTISPLDFSTIVEQVKETFDPSMVKDGDVADAYLAALDNVAELSAAHYQLVTKANDLVRAKRADGEDVSDLVARLTAHGAELLDTYKIIQKDKLKLDIWDVVAYKHDIIQLNLNSLNDTIANLEKGDAEAALESLFNVDTTYLASVFSKEVYEYTGITALDPERDDLYWGTGKTMEQVNTFDVYHAIEDKALAGDSDFSAEIDMLNDMIAFEDDLFARSLEGDTALLDQVADILSASTLKADLDELN